jgi:hypothetical protein
VALALGLLGGLAWAGNSGYELTDGPGGNYAITARFENFNEDALSLFFVLGAQQVRDAMAEYGSAYSELKAIQSACHPCTQAEFDQRILQHYRERGLVPELTAPGHTHVYVDVVAEVLRNRPRVRALAAALDQLAIARQYDSDRTVGAAVALVQTALAYKSPPSEEGGRDILGFYPPPRALQVGSGDCDTKSALLAAILGNFPGVRMIGVHIPHHYLVGIARVPRHGEAYLEYNGDPYVLIEASGPGWMPPGMIASSTQAALAISQNVRVDPLF